MRSFCVNGKMMLLGKVDYIYEFKKEILEYYGKELSRSLYIALARLIVVSSTDEEKDKLRLEYSRVVKAYENMKDKTSYIYRVSEEKKKLSAEIEKKDIIMNDRNALREEFEKRNSKLSDDKKIFNVSDLIERLRAEREKCVKKIKDLNEMVKPAHYSGLKNELVEKMQIMSVLVDDKSLRDCVIDYQNEVMKCFSKGVEKIKSKEEVIDIIYKMRYYRKIRVTDSERLEDIPVLFNYVDRILRFVVTKACKDRFFNIFCQDIEFNYRVISVALDTAISNYEDVDISLRFIDDGALEVTVYDNEVVDRQELMEFTAKRSDLAFREGRRVPLYIF